MLEKKVEDFVRKIETLRTANDVLASLRYAKEDQGTKAANTALDEVYFKLENIHQTLIHTLKNSTIFESINNEPQVDTISNSLRLVINILQNSKNSEIPETAELIEILQFCLDIPNETEISKIAAQLSTYKDKFYPQILMLKKLCLPLEI